MLAASVAAVSSIGEKKTAAASSDLHITMTPLRILFASDLKLVPTS
jgi:hypothetical protein